MSAKKIHIRKGYSASLTRYKQTTGAKNNYNTLSTNEQNNQVKIEFKYMAEALRFS